jgi:RNA polymerase sigma-70 factor (ECF subfamily)
MVVFDCAKLLPRSAPAGGRAATALGHDIPAEEPPDPARHNDLHQAILKLADAHREILQLRYFADCSYREIATALEIPEGTVMSRLHAARLALADIMRKENL